MFDAQPSRQDVGIGFYQFAELVADRMTAMSRIFNVGDHVRWNSEAGRISGVIIKKITSDRKFKAYVHHASREPPQKSKL
jgi:hypothetical protein